MISEEETMTITVAQVEELRERARAWRLEAERLQAEVVRLKAKCGEENFLDLDR